jgi:hypothetical protein
MHLASIFFKSLHMDMDMDHLCPKCRQRFASALGVQTHLNHKFSSCSSFLDDYDALSAFSEQDMRFHVQCAQERAQEHAQERAPQAPFQNPVPSPSLPPPPPPPSISTAPPHINTISSEYHPLLSFIYGQKANTFERIEDNRFAYWQTINPYYPFQGCKEWELARFLAGSSLAQSEVDEFLKLKWVTSFDSPF